MSENRPRIPRIVQTHIHIPRPNRKISQEQTTPQEVTSAIQDRRLARMSSNDSNMRPIGANIGQAAF